MTFIHLTNSEMLQILLYILNIIKKLNEKKSKSNSGSQPQLQLLNIH